MKNKWRIAGWICAALVLLALFALVFITYANPMQNESYDLSPVVDLNEVESLDRSGTLGWSVYTQEGSDITPLVFDGYGCFEGLQYLGQTFYLSRRMNEHLSSPSLALDSIDRNYAVFLDGVMIYTDCPEADNRIGYLTLPARDFERTEPVIISLPEDYVGKTLTIAQSTPLYTDSPRMASRVMPTHVRLYCSYAYESALIAESFKTACLGAAAYSLGTLLLFSFIWQLSQGKFDLSLLLLALSVFLAMTAEMYDTSYHPKYFGAPYKLPASMLCRWTAKAVFLCFLAMKTRRTRIAAWVLCGIHLIMTALRIYLHLFDNIGTGPLKTFVFSFGDRTATVVLLLLLVFGWFERKGDNRFYRWFSPLGCLLIVISVAIPLQLPGRHGYLITLRQAFAHFSLQLFAWPLAFVLITLSVIITMVHILRTEVNIHAEKHLIKEMADMAQQRYENLRRHNEEVMMLRHDMKRHFQLLRQTTTDEKTAAYLDELIGQNNKIRPVIQSGNDMLDTILCGRLSAAMDAGVKVEILRAAAPEKLPITDADLCSLVMNLMDNAITAAVASPEPLIELDLHQKSGFFVFICNNSMTDAPAAPIKEKTVPEHGLGLKIVRQIADRYGFLLKMEAACGTYKVSLAIPLHQPSR